MEHLGSLRALMLSRSIWYGEPRELEPLVGFDASLNSKWLLSFEQDQILLALCGIKIDQIESASWLSQRRYLPGVTHMFQLFSQSCNVIELLIDWENIAGARSPTQYLTGEKQLDVCWQTLCAGQMPGGFSTAKKDFCYKYYTLLRISRPPVRLSVRIFPGTEEDTWYNRGFYFLFRAAWKVLGLTPSKIQRIGFPPQSVLSTDCPHEERIYWVGASLRATRGLDRSVQGWESAVGYSTR